MRRKFELVLIAAAVFTLAGAASPLPQSSAPELKSILIPDAANEYPGEIARLNGLAVEVIVKACQSFPHRYTSVCCEGEDFRHRRLLLDGGHGQYVVQIGLGPCVCIDHGPFTLVKVAYSGPPAPSPTPWQVGVVYKLGPIVETSGKIAQILVNACTKLALEKHVSCDDIAVRAGDVFVMDGETTYPVYFAPSPFIGDQASIVVYVEKPLK